LRAAPADGIFFKGSTGDHSPCVQELATALFGGGFGISLVLSITALTLLAGGINFRVTDVNGNDTLDWQDPLAGGVSDDGNRACGSGLHTTSSVRAIRANIGVTPPLIGDCGTLGSDPNHAYRILDSGHGCGYATPPISSHPKRPVLFLPNEPNGNTQVPIDLLTLDQSPNSHGAARDVRLIQAEPTEVFVLVGESDPLGDSLVQATHWTVTNSVPIAAPLGSIVGEAGQSSAAAFNTADTIVGWSQTSASSMRACVWEPTGTGTWNLSELPGGDGLSEALAIAENGDIAGWAEIDVAGVGVREHAVVWRKMNGSWQLFDLHPAHASNARATGINSDRYVTGWLEDSSENRRAYLWVWETSGNTRFWSLTCRLVESNLSPPSGDTLDWTMLESMEINELGVITAQGERELPSSPGQRERITLLHPRACWADIVSPPGEECVNFEDLVYLLNAWGGTTCPDLLADISGDGMVAYDDLLLLLNEWNCGCAVTEPVPQSIVDCLERFASDPYRAAKCIEAMYLAGTP